MVNRILPFLENDDGPPPLRNDLWACIRLTHVPDGLRGRTFENALGSFQELFHVMTNRLLGKKKNPLAGLDVDSLREFAYDRIMELYTDPDEREAHLKLLEEIPDEKLAQYGDETNASKTEGGEQHPSYITQGQSHRRGRKA